MASVAVDALIRVAHVSFAFLWFAVLFVHGRVMPRALARVEGGENTRQTTALFTNVILPFYWVSAVLTILFGFLLFAQYDPRALSFPIHLGMGVGIVMMVLSLVSATKMRRNLRDWVEGDGYRMETHHKVVKLARVTYWLAMLAILLMVFGSHAPSVFPLPDVTDAV